VHVPDEDEVERLGHGGGERKGFNAKGAEDAENRRGFLSYPRRRACPRSGGDARRRCTIEVLRRDLVGGTDRTGEERFDLAAP